MSASGAPDSTPPPATLLESIDHTPSSLLDAVRTGIVAYAAVWAVTLLLTGAALLAAATEDDVSWSWYLTAPGQAVAMSSHGTLDYTTTVNLEDDFEDELGDEFDEDFEENGGPAFPDEDGDGELSDDELEDLEALPPSEIDDDSMMMSGDLTTSARFTTISLTVLGLMIGALWVASHRAERRRPTPSRNAVLATAAVTGVTFAVLTWAVAFAARVRIDDDFAHAGTLSILFYGSVLGTVVGLLARRPVARHQVVSRLPTALATSVRGVVVYLATFVALLVPAAAIYAIAQGEAQSILVFPLAILNAAVYAITLGQLAGVELQGLPFFFDDAGSTTFWLFSNDIDGVLYVLIPLSIAALGLTAAALSRSSAGRRRTSIDAFWLVMSFAGAGALLTAVSTLTTSTSSFGSLVGGSDSGISSISLAPVSWFFLVMAGWGVITEIAVRTVGRPLAALVPDRFLDRLARS